MENSLISTNGEMTLDQRIQITTMMTLVKQFLPDVAKYYPIAMQQLDLIQNKVDEYLGNNEKMTLAFRIGGKSQVIVIDAKKEYAISNAFPKTGLSVDNRIQELEQELEKYKKIKAEGKDVYDIPEKKEFRVTKEAVLVNEGVRSFIENKVLANGTVKYVLEMMRDEYNQKFSGQQQTPPSDSNSGMSVI